MSKGTVYQRRDGRWECRISMGKDDKGKRVFRSFYGKSREEAEYKAMVAQGQADEEYAVTEMTVKELVTEWLHVTASRIKESTAANYTMKAEKHLIPAFGEMKCCLLKAKDIYAFIESKLKEGLSARYLTDIIVLFKSIFRYASREYRIRNVFDGIILPKKNKPEIAVMNKDQQLRLEEYLREHPSFSGIGINLSLYMGLRIGEVCALQWSDIDLEKRTLTVSKTIQRMQCKTGLQHTKLIITEPKSESSKRTIPIPDCLLSLLRQFKDNGDVYVVSGKNKPIEPRTMQYRFAKILHNADLPSFHYHSTRHLFATRCIELGFDVKTLSEILGHSSVEVTLLVYLKISSSVCLLLIMDLASGMIISVFARYHSRYLKNASSA